MMTISSGKVAVIHYQLSTAEGELLESSRGEDPMEYLHGRGNIIAGLEKALEGKAVGDLLSVEVSPEEGYGAFDEDLVVEVPRSEIPVEELEAGMKLSAETSSGDRLFTVVEVAEDQVTLDGNHPLAGEILCFEVEVMGIRDATPEELVHGHAHSGGCCG